jgi:8-oxo-dGTP pyrophosphatase MutT (NUDIX family)
VTIEQGNNRLAAVALILRNPCQNPEIFFIQRAVNENDPWSGQIAFPGGNMEDQDQDGIATARRETLEEVGLVLSPSSLLGRLDDQQGRSNFREIPLVISCNVFELDIHQRATNGYEVGDSFWVGLDHLINPLHRFDYLTGYAPDPYPAVRLGEDKILWGLTYRFVQMFLGVIGRSPR